MTADEDLETLREQTERGDRTDEDARSAERAELQSSIVNELAEIDAGDRQKTVSVWDGQLAALFATLEKDEFEEDLEAIGVALRREFDISNEDPPDRSEVLRLLLRLGLREAAPEYHETLREALKEHATRNI